MVKLKDIAKYLGISVTTVSYSLNNDPRIPPSTKQRVLDAAAELGYSGRSGKSSDREGIKQVVLCLNSMSGGIYSEIVNAMKGTLNLNNCELMIYIGSDITRLKLMDGLFILNSKVSNEDIEKIASRRIPVVLMDRGEAISDAVNVTLDNFNGCNATTRWTVDEGARTFAFIGGPKESYESKYRYDGFCKALEDNGLADKVIMVLQTDFTYEGGLNAFRFLYDNGDLPEAIVCANDETAAGIIAGMKSAGVTRRVIVAGFDGVKAMETSSVKFVTAKADHRHWGTAASYAMIQLFNHQSRQSMKIPVKLVEYPV